MIYFSCSIGTDEIREMKAGSAWCLLRDHLLLTKKWQNPPKGSLGNMYFVPCFYCNCVNPIDLLSSKALTGMSEECLLGNVSAREED